MFGLLFFRLPVASVLVLAGLAKLTRNEAMTQQLWRPSHVPAKVWPTVIGATSGLEIVVAWMVLVAPAQWAISSAAGLMASVTAYGYAAISRTGTCGCFGRLQLANRRSLVARNTLLFLGVITGAALTPVVDVALLSRAAPVLSLCPAMVVLAPLFATAARRSLLRNRRGGFGFG